MYYFWLFLVCKYKLCELIVVGFIYRFVIGIFVFINIFEGYFLSVLFLFLKDIDLFERKSVYMFNIF